MARGKYAARAATARAEDAKGTVVELQQQLAVERARWSTERGELQRQIAKLESTLRREVGFLALEQVAVLTEEHERQLAILREQVTEARAYAKKFKDGLDRATGELIALARAEASTRAGKAQVLADLLRGERVGAIESAQR